MVKVYKKAVHPHARGEHQGALSTDGARVGSSPRSWGTQPLCRPERPVCRFIPTLVGNTREISSQGAAGPVHPHARGEHFREVIKPNLSLGSSPRSWGTRLNEDRIALERRFIPTLVGNTRGQYMQGRAHSVHPHARGEHLDDEAGGHYQGGSSPRSWGPQS